jgi:hypothetical protein
MRRNFIEFVDDGDTMAMQPQGVFMIRWSV